MKAEVGRVYAQIQRGKCHWLFSAEELPEWNNNQCPAIDVTGNVPEVGDDWDGATFNKPVGPALSEVKADFIAKVDTDADAIYATALGNRETEYAQAEAEAGAYRTAGYSGDVPSYVQAWASAKGKPAQWAADDILATALAWRTAQAAIRTNRLACKEAARSAQDVEALEAVQVRWNAFVAAIINQLRTS